MRRGWLRRNRLTTTLPHTIRLYGRVCLPLLLLAASTFRRYTALSQRTELESQARFFGEVSEQRPWA
jgi:hypothetical protein